MSDTTAKPSPEVAIDYPADVLRAYSNHINIQWNVFDLRLAFGDSDVVPAPDGKIHVQTRAVITVSWTEAKQIAELLTEVVRRFEDANGTIKRISEMKVP